jgi:dolichol-phosphate mannosyltransferase
VRAGFAASTAPLVITFPADDDYNAPRLDRMIALGKQGYAVVSASRFLPGGAMVGCPWVKATLVRVASFLLCHLARVPSHDATNGLRLFSRELLEATTIESRVGFAFSIELLVKAHRMQLPIAELPFVWHERRVGTSRFNILGWLPEYLGWARFAFATTFLRRRTSPLPSLLSAGDR